MVNLNDQNILMQIMQETKQKWRNCKRKQYNIYACKMPKDVVFANKLEQPDSYKAMKRILGKYIATVDECRKHQDLMQVLAKGGFYQTDGSCITLCGTAGELWTVKEEKLRSSYTSSNGTRITEIPKDWFTVSRAAEMTPQAVGIYIPKKYIGVYQTAWGATLYMNNPNSEGHNKGDILVVPLINGNLNLADCSPTNNTVFARTYDLTVGGWSNLGIKADASKPFTFEDCKRLYQVPKTASLMYSFQGVLDSLCNESLIPKMVCAYHDLEELNTVWFETVGDSRVQHLSKDFYCGVVNGDFPYVAFRNIMGDECDLDVEVKPTLESVQRCMHRVLTCVKQGYQDYKDTYKFLVLSYGDSSSDVTGELMEIETNDGADGFAIGVYVGLKDSILRSIGAFNKNADAYVLVTLTFAMNKDATDISSHIDVLMQGDVADSISRRLGKGLHCRATTLSGIKKQVTAMLNAITSIKC